MRLRIRNNKEYENNYRHCLREVLFEMKSQNYAVKLCQVIYGPKENDIYCTVRDDEKRKSYYLSASRFGVIVERLYET